MGVLLRHYPEKEKEEGGDEEESWEKDREIDKKASEWAAPGGLMTLLVACSGPRDQGCVSQWRQATEPRVKWVPLKCSVVRRKGGTGGVPAK